MPLRMSRRATKSRWASWLEIRIADRPQKRSVKTRAPLTQKRPYCCGNESGCGFGMVAILLCVCSIQGLVFPEIGNGKAERVNLNEVVAHGIAEGKNKVSGVLRAFDLAAVERRFVNQLIFNRGLVRGGAKVLDVDAIDFDFLVGGRTGKEVVNGLVLGPCGESVVGQLRVHEQQGAPEVVTDG